MQTQLMLRTHPQARGAADDALVRCIDAAHACVQACTSCADACLGEPSAADLVQCIHLDLDCADLCAATAAVATRRTGSDDEVLRRLLDSCAAASRACGEECERHADMHEHRRICAEACRACQRACEQAGQGMSH
jgi:hypothetical protein